MAQNYDFCGWATKNDIKCSDGRTIKKDAFKHNDGDTVPLVWNHDHKEMSNVIGHALLENRDEGVYAYCSLNDTEMGKEAKELVKHGDIRSLSIYANHLKQKGGDVIHGAIREVSLVLAGANPGAFIETVVAHSDDTDEEATIFCGEDEEGLDLEHGCCGPEKKKKKEMEHAASEAKAAAEQTPAAQADANKAAEGAKGGKTVQEVFDSLSEEQKTVVYAIIGQAVEDAKKEAGSASHSDDDEEENTMKQNAFEKKTNENLENDKVLTHDEFTAINEEAKRTGSLKDAFMQHSITDISNYYPEVQLVNKEPLKIQRRLDWVQEVLGATHKSPFARIKSTAANLTADDARAKGYVKGNQKAEEVIVALKRTTTPTTVYKLQKIDRDDVIDITDFNVVSFLKSEMKDMLNEELARAILIGDGRSASSNDKINALNIRPIWQDSNVYTVNKTMEQAAGSTSAEFYKEFIRDIVRARKDYKGSGNPVFFTTEDVLTEMLLLEDTNGHRIYKSEAELATAIRASKIVTVPVMENVKRTADSYDYFILGVLVNLVDYNIGMDKGGEVSFFDDFDINYNKYEYLIETRRSGALVKPYSAITFEKKQAA